MNYLAHAYLSFNEPEILVGNLISDFVKGRKKFDFSAGIQKGIALHRAIDNFTDDHVATKAAKLFFSPIYRLYAGAFVDVAYDHFLAIDDNEFGSGRLKQFSSNVYQILEENFHQLPFNFKYFFGFMKKQDWLSNYQYRWGIEKGFGGLVNRAAYLTESETAYLIFNKNYNELKECYNDFFPQLKEFASDELRNLLNT
jgi:acyl carrier protein phosphodiesterase